MLRDLLPSPLQKQEGGFMTVLQCLRAAAVLATCAAAQMASAACYYVYSPSNELIYRSNRTPVDLTYQLHNTLPSVYPGARMVFTLDEFNCATEVNLIAERRQLDNARSNRHRSMSPMRGKGKALQQQPAPVNTEDLRFQKS